jgi:RNA recognition motif-containing protein
MSEAPAAVPATNGTPVVEAPKVEDVGFKVFAGNLAYTTTDEGLKTFFAPLASDIISAQVIQRGTRSAGYGFVALKTEEAAYKSVELLHKKELDGREVIVEVAKPAELKDAEKKEKKAKRRAGRRGAKPVPGEVTDAEANAEAAAAGETPDGEKPKKAKKKKTKKPKKTPVEGAVEAVEGAATAVKKKITPKKKAPRTPRPAGEDPVGEPSKSVLFVANLGFSVDDAALSALFTDAGIQPVSARIVRRRWGQPRRSKGYGFVDVGSEENQTQAIEALQGKEIDGRAIAVKIAVNTPPEDDKDAEAPAAVAAPATETPAPAPAA